ncbi:MAG: hypothetical protein U0T81_09520 [Saprospiraceae bacterium]
MLLISSGLRILLIQGWRAGVTGALAGNGGCTLVFHGHCPQWTLAATSATHKAVPNGIRLGDNRINCRTWTLNGANQTNTDTFDLRSAQVTSRVVCGRTISDTSDCSSFGTSAW